MKKYSVYPFYKSIRFRFGLLFNCLLLLLLSGIVLLLYSNIRHELEQGFERRLALGANIILQKADVSPITVPLPQSGEYLLLTYDHKIAIDTLFNNLPAAIRGVGQPVSFRTSNWWGTRVQRKLETGAILSIDYFLPADEYNAAINSTRQLLFIYIPVAVMIAFVAGYFLSGIFLRPLQKMITKANRIDLSATIKLLDEPVVKDELHELTDAINRMLTRINKQSQAQNNFFASASHELRTPLSNMLTELQTIDQKQVSPETKTLLQNQLTEVKRLKELVNNFLWMSQLKSDNTYIKKQLLNLADVCIEGIETYRLLAQEKGLGFKISLQPNEANFMAFADKNQLSVAWGNLVSNAVKYSTPGSGIDVIIREDNGVSLTITNQTNQVINNPANLKNEFTRGDAYQEGFGLGLWIADQLVLKNEGSLQLSMMEDRFVAILQLPEAVVGGLPR